MLKSLAETVVAFGDLPPDSTAIAGGKGASLSRMAAAGLPVPPGFVVAAGAFHDFLESCGGVALIAGLTNDLDVDDARAVEQAAERNPAADRLHSPAGTACARRFWPRTRSSRTATSSPCVRARFGRRASRPALPASRRAI